MYNAGFVRLIENVKSHEIQGFHFSGLAKIMNPTVQIKSSKITLFTQMRKRFFPFGLFYVVEIYDNVSKTKDNKI